jgi:hypothetical protein
MTLAFAVLGHFAQLRGHWALMVEALGRSSNWPDHAEWFTEWQRRVTELLRTSRDGAGGFWVDPWQV